MASGATGGHLYPCLAIADAIRLTYPDARLLFVGPKGKTDEQLIQAHGFESATISASGVSRTGGAFRPWQVLKAISFAPVAEALRLLRQFRPHVVFGAGGYVSGPVIAAAWLKNIPRAILEANAIPGLANRLAARLANSIFIGFDPAAKYFSRRKVVLMGNPVRTGSKAEGQRIRADLGFEEGKLLIVVVGGSLGSRFLNEVMLSTLPLLSKHRVASRLQVLHCVGKRFWDQFGKTATRVAVGLNFKYVAVPFVPELHNLFYACHVVVCRGGAMTLSEIAAAGALPIIIPWPGAANNEQLANAQFFQRNGAAVLIEEKHLDERRLQSILVETIDNDADARKMRDNCRRIGRPDAAKLIASALMGFGRR